MTAAALTELHDDLAAVPGTVSIWCGPPGSAPAFTVNADATHYAASTMKVAVLAAAYRLADAGLLDLDADVPVHDDFPSRSGAGTYRNNRDYDSDPEPWERLGATMPLRSLVKRMIVRSSNLATNLVLEQVWAAEPDALDRVWKDVDAAGSTTPCGIEDDLAREAGIRNYVTAADLAGLLAAIRGGDLASAASSLAMMDTLLAQEVDHDIVRGLPAGTRVAHKNGWVTGVHHSAALIFPPDARPFTLVTCATADLDHDAGWALLARVASAAWEDRHALGGGTP